MVEETIVGSTNLNVVEETIDGGTNLNVVEETIVCSTNFNVVEETIDDDFFLNEFFLVYGGWVVVISSTTFKLFWKKHGARNFLSDWSKPPLNFPRESPVFLLFFIVFPYFLLSF